MPYELVPNVVTILSMSIVNYRFACIMYTLMFLSVTIDHKVDTHIPAQAPIVSTLEIKV
jgi:hypothetical protein